MRGIQEDGAEKRKEAQFEESGGSLKQRSNRIEERKTDG